MINVLRLKIKDVEFNDSKGLLYYEKQVIDLVGNRDVMDLNKRDFFELCRLRIICCLLAKNNKEGYINLYVNDALHAFMLSFDGVDEDKSEPVVEGMGADVDNRVVYYPFKALYINQSWYDPFVHYDAERNIFAIPANVFQKNEKLLKELQLDDETLGRWTYCKDLNKYLSYDEDYEIWVYDSCGVLEDSQYEKYKTGWNYEAAHDNLDENAIYAFDREGNNVGRMHMICEADLNEMLIIKEKSQGLNSLIDAKDYDFKLSFEPTDKMLLVYIAKPTDGFMLVALDPVKERTASLPIELKLCDYDGVSDKMVLDMNDNSFYVPLHSVDYVTRDMLIDLGYTWSEDDLSTIENIKGILSDKQQEIIVAEALADIHKYGIRKAMENLVDKLIKTKSMRLEDEAREELIDSLIKYFQDVYMDRKERWEKETGRVFPDVDGFFDDYGLEDDLDSDSEDIEEENEDEIKF